MIKQQGRKRPEDWKTPLYDIKENMVLIKSGKDKGVYKDSTYNIASLSFDSGNAKHKVRFVGDKNNEYSYDVILLDSPERKDINGEVFCKSGVYIRVDYLLCFKQDDKAVTRIIYEDGCYETVETNSLLLDGNHFLNPNIINMIDYIEKIARAANASAENQNSNNDLENQVKRIKYIGYDSVLYKYLTKGDITVSTLEKGKTIYPFNFNLSQKAALENALTHSVSVIQGPPGTGKTQTILNIIANLVAVQHKSVAVVSNNNDAVSNVEAKLEAGGYGGLTAFLGNKDVTADFFNKIKDSVMSIDSWNVPQDMDMLCRENARLSNMLNTLLEIQRSKKRKEQELRNWQVEQKHFEAFFSLKMDSGKEAQMPAHCRTADEIMEFLAENAAMQKGSRLARLAYRFKLIFKYRLKIFEVPRQKLLIRLQKEYYILQIQNIVNEISLLEYQLKHNNFDAILKQYQGVSEKLFQKYLYSYYKGMKKKHYIKCNYKEDFENFIKRYPVMLSTTQALMKSVPDNYLFDYVIIDEASQVDIVRAMLVFSCCRNVIIVGDEQQLTHIVDKEVRKLESQLSPVSPKYDYFNKNIISSMRSLYVDKLPSTTLLEHYRCHPQIIEFCNQRYYGGRLIACTAPDGRERPLILHRTQQGNHMRKNTEGETGIYNQRELECVQEIINEYDIDPNADIGIVTPYKLQAKKAERMYGGYESGTVHRYQGREKDIIIFTTVVDNKPDNQNGIKFVDEPHMINVAVSRAKDQFILDTHPSAFEVNGKEIRALMQYILYNYPTKKKLESKIVSVFDLLYKEHSKKLLPLKQRLNKEANYKSEEIIRVVLEKMLAEEEYDNLYGFDDQVLLSTVTPDKCGGWKPGYTLSKEEYDYVDRGASVDFMIMEKMNKNCVLAIEVDGHAYHENNPKKWAKDKMKDSILEKCGIPLLRLPTNGSREEEKIKEYLKNISAEGKIKEQLNKAMENQKEKKQLPLKQRLNKEADYKSEEIIRVLLEKILAEEAYHNLYGFDDQVLLSTVTPDKCGGWKPGYILSKEEYDYVDRGASVDFMIMEKMNKNCVLAIEVDVHAYHENNPKKLARDKMKNSILEKCGIPLLRLSINGSREEEKIKEQLNKAMNKQKKNSQEEN